MQINLLNAELNPIRHLLALVGARHIVHVSRVRVNQRDNDRRECTYRLTNKYRNLDVQK
jgi:hypothetical protein